MFVRILELDDMVKVRSEPVLRSLGVWIGALQGGQDPSCLLCDEPLTVSRHTNKFVAVEIDEKHAKVWAVCPNCVCRPEFEFDLEVGLQKALA